MKPRAVAGKDASSLWTKKAEMISIATLLIWDHGRKSCAGPRIMRRQGGWHKVLLSRGCDKSLKQHLIHAGAFKSEAAPASHQVLVSPALDCAAKPRAN